MGLFLAVPLAPSLRGYQQLSIGLSSLPAHASPLKGVTQKKFFPNFKPSSRKDFKHPKWNRNVQNQDLEHLSPCAMLSRSIQTLWAPQHAAPEAPGTPQRGTCSAGAAAPVLNFHPESTQARAIALSCQVSTSVRQGSEQPLQSTGFVLAGPSFVPGRTSAAGAGGCSAAPAEAGARPRAALPATLQWGG